MSTDKYLVIELIFIKNNSKFGLNLGNVNILFINRT